MTNVSEEGGRQGTFGRWTYPSVDAHEVFLDPGLAHRCRKAEPREVVEVDEGLEDLGAVEDR